MSLTNHGENATLNWLLGGTGTPPATWYVGLSTADPGEAGTPTEPSGSGYARVAVTNNTTNFPAAANGSKSNGTQIQWPAATGAWGTVTHVFLADAATAGNVWAKGALPTGKAIVSGDQPYYGAGELTFTQD